tara:strand:- start:61 stop:369 length:309 start_codon:yes stop_codon:yes gene_type:complete
MEDTIIIFGACLMSAAGVVQVFKLYALNKLLNRDFPEIASYWGLSNKKIHFLARFKRLRMFSTSYTAEDRELNSLLVQISRIQWLFFAGLVLIITGVVWHAF